MCVCVCVYVQVTSTVSSTTTTTTTTTSTTTITSTGGDGLDAGSGRVMISVHDVSGTETAAGCSGHHQTVINDCSSAVNQLAINTAADLVTMMTRRTDTAAHSQSLSQSQQQGERDDDDVSHGDVTSSQHCITDDDDDDDDVEQGAAAAAAAGYMNEGDEVTVTSRAAGDGQCDDDDCNTSVSMSLPVTVSAGVSGTAADSTSGLMSGMDVRRLTATHSHSAHETELLIRQTIHCLTYNQLKHADDWIRLARHLHFTQQHINAIRSQFTGQCN